MPSPELYRSWGQHIKNNIDVDEQEISFLRRAADLVKLANAEEQGWLDDLVEESLSRCSPKDARTWFLVIVPSAG